MVSTSATHPGNNFDFIRIVAASMVLVSHHYALTGQMEPSFFGLYSLGGLAVTIFFIISGYLVMTSWQRDPNVFRFGLRRFLRIWPALTFVVIFVAYGLGTWVTTLPAREYLQHGATSAYLATLWMKIHYVLPGVFEHNPYALGVNGSLWTIPYEVRCYIVLGTAGALGLLKRKTILLAAIAIFMAWYFKKSNPDITGTLNYGRELSAFFLAGVALCALQPYWQRNPLLWSSIIGTGFIAFWYVDWKHTAMLLGLPFLVIFIGNLASPVISQAGRWGDPSYGIYLFAFPIQQTVILYTWPASGFLGTMALSMAITVAMAYASWHVIEKQALKFKPRKS